MYPPLSFPQSRKKSIIYNQAAAAKKNQIQVAGTKSKSIANHTHKNKYRVVTIKKNGQS